MKFAKNLSWRNLRRKPVRTFALILLTAFLSFSIFGGSMVVMSLQNGLDSYQSRLGADVVVVPYEAQTRGTLESILLQGIPGYFYMDMSYLEKIRGMEGVETATPQFFLASTSAGCCSAAVQIIGFDPDTDVSIQPWVQEHYSGSVGDGDLIVGSAITVPADRELVFYNTPCRVVAQLGETGTGLDQAVYANMNTIKSMMRHAQELGFGSFDGIDADHAISSVMVQVKEGYRAEDVANDINIHVRGVEAQQTQSMISSIAGGLSNVSRVIGILMILIWVLALAVLMLAFVLIGNERTKEFAILRVMGASKRMLSSLLRTESMTISAIGTAVGIGAACLVLFPFHQLVRTQLSLPYLMPGAAWTVALMLGSVLLSMLAGWLAASLSAYRIAHNETGLILREGA